MIDFHIFTTFLIFVLGLFFLTLKNGDSLKIRKIYLFIVSIILILESGLRGKSVGDDTANYSDIFDDVKYTSWKEIIGNLNFFSERNYENRDPGYDVFQKVFQIFSDDYRIYLFFIAIIFFSSLYHFLLRNNFTQLELILAASMYSALFYYFFSITGIRQAITTTVALYCIKFIKEKQFLQFTIPIVLISLVHVSVLIFLPFYFVSSLKKIRFHFLIALILFVVIFIFKQSIFLILLSGSVYENYLNDLDGAGTFVFTSLMFLVVLSSYFFINKMEIKYLDYRMYYNAMLIALVLLPLTFVNSNAMRVVQYYSIFLLVFTPKIIEVAFFKKVFLKKFVYFFCIAILLFFVSKSTAVYKFYWEESSNYRDY
jgi:transmembrane protein EpsG